MIAERCTEQFKDLLNADEPNGFIEFTSINPCEELGINIMYMDAPTTQGLSPS